MRTEDLRALLDAVAQGSTSVEDAQTRLSRLPFEDLGYARVDHHRHLRTGAPEVVYGPGKTAEQIASIVDRLFDSGQLALVTRVEEAKAKEAISLMKVAKDAIEYEPVPRFLVAGAPLEIQARGPIAVVTAGTSDINVAEEAARTAELLGHEVRRFQDVGVAGLHRILSVRDGLEACEVIIVAAGMEGALPSVVKGLVSRPVIGLPTSVGFGVNFQGMSALMSMLTSCTPGLTVVNIDNGFGAGYAASLMCRVRA